MKLRHFFRLKPHCLACASEENGTFPLAINRVEVADSKGHENESIIEGVIRCSNLLCQCEYPIIDGIPFLLPNVRETLAASIGYIQARSDLCATTQSLLSDCCAPDSEFNVNRQYLSSYGWCHYGDLNPKNSDSNAGSTFQAFQVMDDCLNSCRPNNSICSDGGEVAIDLGCSVGRNSFAIASKTNKLTLGVDLNFSMLKMATRILRAGKVEYPLRRGGVVYDDIEFHVDFEHSDLVDFWACDATQLPFADDIFGRCNCMNTLDSVASPFALLQSIARVLSEDGQATLACPYDWSSSATAIESWIGGHSQRADHRGMSDAVIRNLLTSPNQGLSSLRLVSEQDNIPWVVRIHDRSQMHYSLHGIIIEKHGSKS